MAVGPQWRFELVSSKDDPGPPYKPLPPLGELRQARDKQVSVIHNRPGSASFRVPLTHPLTLDIEPVTTGIIAYRNNQPIWSGMVWTMEENVPDDTVSVSCVGWFEALNHRLTATDNLSYAALEDAIIARNLIEHARTTAPFDFIPTVQTISTADGTYNTRTVSYPRYTNVGRAVIDLTEIEGGCDFTVDPVTRTLKFTPYRGKTRDAFFMYPGNLSRLTRQIDGSDLANKFFAVGPYSAQVASWATSVSTYGTFEDMAQLPALAQDNVLAAYAGVEVIFRKVPRVTYNLVPRPYVPTYSPETGIGSQTSGNVPQPFVDYDVGDVVFLRASRGRLQVPSQSFPKGLVVSEGQGIRIFGINIAIDNEGNERVTSLQTSPP